jgi:hypothetical protein
MTDPRPYSAPYDMRCPIARTLDIVGDRWTILILRDLVTGFYEEIDQLAQRRPSGRCPAIFSPRDRLFGNRLAAYEGRRPR